MPITKLHGWQVEYTNDREYHLLKQETFGRDHYWFETDNPRPRIIDAGAHIGLATLYFLTNHPHAQITAIEPNPYLVKLLERNIWMNQVENQVKIMPVALGETTGTTQLYLDNSEDQWWSTGSVHEHAWTGDQSTLPITVPMQPLTDWLTQPIDLLKLDIEGHEQAVLKAAGSQLQLVDQMVIEFHPHETQSLTTLIAFLTNLGFQVSIWKRGKEATINQAGNSLVLLRAKQKKAPR